MNITEAKPETLTSDKRRTAGVARSLGRYVFWVVGRPMRWGPADDAGVRRTAR